MQTIFCDIKVDLKALAETVCEYQKESTISICVNCLEKNKTSLNQKKKEKEKKNRRIVFYDVNRTPDMTFNLLLSATGNSRHRVEL